ncbi:hypothetical protein [Xanthomonas campestris]|uniref:hypothetical protein n=1 Tax=Xanthomonas campestris TaxID=339 RepID=UPI0035569467
MSESEVNFTFRCKRSLKSAFVEKAKKNNRNASLLLRDYMETYTSDPSAVAAETASSKRAKNDEQ